MVLEFEIMFAPWEGDAPPEQIRADAEAYAFPMYVGDRPPGLEDPG